MNAGRKILPIFCLVFLSGCANASVISFPRVGEQLEPEAYTEHVQYAAPWDKALYDTLYERAASEERYSGNEQVKGGIVPHHLVAGHTTAAFFETIKKQHPSTVVLIGPNHFSAGAAPFISTRQDWATPYGNLHTNHELARQLSHDQLLFFEENVVQQEHSIYSLTTFLARSLPDANVLPIIVRNGTDTAMLDRLVERLHDILPPDAVIVASVDFSHYQTLPVADFHDETSMNVIQTSDFSRLQALEIDSVPSVYVLLKLMESYNTQHVAYEEHTNAARITGAFSERETTSHYIPYFVQGEPKKESVASLLHFGDIMLDRNVKKQIDRYGPRYPFEALAGREGRFFQGMDIVSANLEGPFADYRRETSKEIAFQFAPVLIDTLKTFHFDLFTLANNHSLDMGRQGFRESQEHLREANIDFYGEQLTVGETSVLVRNVGQRTIGFIGLNDTNIPLDVEKVRELIEGMRAKVDDVVVNIHWGVEYQPLSHPRQRFLAHAFIDAGADVVIGHHPHVVQEIEIYKDRPIFYSLGNFIFDQYFSRSTQEGLSVGLVFYPNRISIYLFPFESNKSQVKQMAYDKATLFMKELVDRSRLGNYTFDMFHLTLNTYYE